jgi:hypothetical protein
MYMVLMEKHEGKTPLGIPIRIWDDRIRVDLREIG